jgi:hypothetical protein
MSVEKEREERKDFGMGLYQHLCLSQLHATDKID